MNTLKSMSATVSLVLGMASAYPALAVTTTGPIAQPLGFNPSAVDVPRAPDPLALTLSNYAPQGGEFVAADAQGVVRFSFEIPVPRGEHLKPLVYGTVSFAPLGDLKAPFEGVADSAEFDVESYIINCPPAQPCHRETIPVEIIGLQLVSAAPIPSTAIRYVLQGEARGFVKAPGGLVPAEGAWVDAEAVRAGGGRKVLKELSTRREDLRGLRRLLFDGHMKRATTAFRAGATIYNGLDEIPIELLPLTLQAMEASFLGAARAVQRAGALVRDRAYFVQVNAGIRLLAGSLGPMATVLPTTVLPLWPKVDMKAKKTYYEPKLLKIFLLEGDEGDETVFWHEFGHYLMHVKTGKEFTGGYHKAWLNSNEKLAFSEGFATFLGNTLAGTPIYTDTKDYDLKVDLEADEVTEYGKVPPRQRGPANEVSIASALWDLYDGGDNDDDAAQFPLEKLIKALCPDEEGKVPMTIHEYLDRLRELCPDQADVIDAVAAAHTIIPV
ncbi:MAG: hypothetical protein ACREV1_03270 [Gammaproteobacteria bacterium]